MEPCQLKNGSINVYDPPKKDAVMVWEFKQAFPVEFPGPDLNAQQNNVAVETLELSHPGHCVETEIRRVTCHCILQK